MEHYTYDEHLTRMTTFPKLYFKPLGSLFNIHDLDVDFAGDDIEYRGGIRTYDQVVEIMRRNYNFSYNVACKLVRENITKATSFLTAADIDILSNLLVYQQNVDIELIDNARYIGDVMSYPRFCPYNVEMGFFADTGISYEAVDQEELRLYLKWYQDIVQYMINSIRMIFLSEMEMQVVSAIMQEMKKAGDEEAVSSGINMN
jgi:hypothetical protein